MGAQSGKYFEYPELDQNELNKQFQRKSISKIHACVGVGVYSLKLEYQDGTCSPCFGSRQDFNQCLDLNSMPRVSNIAIRAWKQNYIQSLVIKSGDKEVSLVSQSTNGEVQEFEGGKIVGVHGYLDANDDVRGIGLILI